MIDVDLPAGGAPELVRSFAACLASAGETPLADLPLPEADLRGAVGAWRGWLAGRGAGLVPIAAPERFAWAGYWIAVLDGEGGEGVAVLLFGTPPGVVLSPQDPRLLGRAAADLPVHEGWLLASLDPVLAAPPAPARVRGRVEAIAVADEARGPMRVVDAARALAGRGLDGDRYARSAGTFTPRSGTGSGYDLTLVEAEVLEQLVLPGGARLAPADARRNLVTRGVALDDLIGRRFRVGDVECLGRRRCEPCAHLERLTAPGVLRGLVHRGGLRADVLTDGRISVGAVVETLG